MSWSFNNPCWNCEKVLTEENPDGCKDAFRIQESINKLHADNDGHKGCGEIVMSCSNCTSRNK